MKTKGSVDDNTSCLLQLLQINEERQTDMKSMEKKLIIYIIIVL